MGLVITKTGAISSLGPPLGVPLLAHEKRSERSKNVKSLLKKCTVKNLFPKLKN